LGLARARKIDRSAERRVDTHVEVARRPDPEPEVLAEVVVGPARVILVVRRRYVPELGLPRAAIEDREVGPRLRSLAVVVGVDVRRSLELDARIPGVGRPMEDARHAAT